MGNNGSNKITDEDKGRIVSKTLEGLSVKAISDQLNLKYSSVHRIVTQFNKTGVYLAKYKGGDTRSKLNEEQKEKIINWVDDDCLLRLSDLKQKLFQHYSIEVSISTIDRVLKEFHYTIKSVVAVPEKRNCAVTKSKRLAYAAKFRELESNYEHKNLIFLDEVGYAVVTRPKRGRARVGVSPYVKVSAARSRNISVVAAMNKYGMIFHKIHDTAVTGETFKKCLSEIKTKCINAGIDNSVLIMDNARIHHYKGLADIIKDMELNLVYLPPYSPFLNPIENVFSVWKNLVIRSQVHTENDLKKEISNKFNEITTAHCDSFYRKMLAYIGRSERDEDIFE